MVKNSLFVLLFCCSLFGFGQSGNDYFRKLQTQRVESSELVSWTQIGPGMAGYCEEFWCHPTDANVMFMSPDMYNSYGSWDNGKSWQTIKDCDGSGKDMNRMRKFEFSHQNPNFGLAISASGLLYKTENEGRNWQIVESYKPVGKLAELTVDPSDDRIWYIGPGDFWDVKKNHRSINGEPEITKNAAIYKSTNKGLSWQKLTKGLVANLDVGRILVDPSNSQILLAATSQGLYRSTNQGDNWTLCGNELSVNRPRDLTYYYNKGDNEFIIYLLEQSSFDGDGKSINSKGGVYKSVDHGWSWQNISGNLAVNLQKISSPYARNKYWKSVAFWLGKNEKEVKAKYSELPTSVFSIFNRLRVNPNNKNEIYLTQNTNHDMGFIPGDVWKSSDGGQNWITTARTGSYWEKGADNDYWKSRNNPVGVNTKFAHLQSEMNNREETAGNRFFAINAAGDLFICLNQQVLRSNDHGESWSQVDDIETFPGSSHWMGRGDSNLPGRFMLLETGIKNRYLFCSGEHGLWQTTGLDGYPDKMAVAVKQIEGQLNPNGATSIASVAVHPKDPNIIYINMFRQDHRGYIRKSTDGGKTWNDISYPLKSSENISSSHIFQYSLTVDYDQPENLYFCVISNPIAEVSGGVRDSKSFRDFGVYKSSDGGLTWSMKNFGLPAGGSVRRIIVDPTHSNILYAALNESRNGEPGGLYKSIDRAETWREVKIPAPIKSVNNVFVDRHTHQIFISCGGEKGILNEGGVWKSNDDGASWDKIFDMPYIWQTETSPVNPDIITVNAPLPVKNKEMIYNPGAYLSMDGGKTWNKINHNLGQPDRITDLKPDPYRQDVFWCALKGSGWSVGYLKGTTKGWSEAH